MPSLVFIDTNIFLDFYRMEGGEAAKKQLKFIDDNHDRIITGDQVKMEFMKNRQQVITDTIKKIKNSGANLGQVPPVLVDSQPHRQIKISEKRIKSQQKKLRARIERMLTNPIYSDKVYQCAQRLFKSSSPLNLARTKEIRIELRELAQKRYMLGYPPRKKGDTSIGDAVNWEWIIHCANEQNANVLIVSRDGDFGPFYEGNTYINDWLSIEFKARVNKQRKVTLTNKLTEAMKLLNVVVSEAEEVQEEKLLSTWTPFAKTESQWTSLQRANLLEVLLRAREHIDDPTEDDDD